jgi:hypothetical protein
MSVLLGSCHALCDVATREVGRRGGQALVRLQKVRHCVPHVGAVEVLS